MKNTTKVVYTPITMYLTLIWLYKWNTETSGWEVDDCALEYNGEDATDLFNSLKDEVLEVAACEAAIQISAVNMADE